MFLCFFFFFKQKTAYEMRISDWSSDVCSSDLGVARHSQGRAPVHPVKAYKNNEFLMSEAARGLRILCEYAEPERRFRQTGVRTTVAFFGSARVRAGLGADGRTWYEETAKRAEKRAAWPQLGRASGRGNECRSV